ncbi:fibronectin, partial [Biomphalaria glabrata]
MPQRSQPHFSGTSGSQDVVKITKDGFYPSEKSITEGEDVLFEWDETAIGVPNLIQVVNDGKELKPVVDGYGGSRGPNGTFRQRFYLGGQYKFAVNPIRFTPFTVTVKKRSDIIVEVTDDGFFPAILDINQGQGVHWVWRSCSVPHTVKEYTYLFNKRAFQPKDQKIVATISGAYQQSFRKPGVYYFKTESSEPGKSPLCVVRVRNGNIEHKIDVLDHTFEPSCLVVQEGDRVWWEWTKEKCTKMHNIFQINAPPLDHEADSNFEPTSDGFQWPHKPSKQGLLTHKFTKAGVYFYSDRNYDEAAIYMGTIIVKPKPKEHVVKINDLGFSPDILRVNTDELVWMIWNTSSYSTSGKLVQIVEEDKVLGSTIETRDTEEIDADPVKAEDLRVMTKAGIAFLNFSTTGVYTYKLIDKTNKSISAISMIANPGPKNHTVNVTDFGFEPQVVSIRPNDRVWWLWQHVKKQHNIVQVSHSKNVIPNGFCSGLPRDGQSAFHHQFCNSGVFYFKSEKIPDIYGSIVVSTEPNICCQVHEIEVAQKEPETTTVQINDIVCWTFPVPVDEDVVALKSLNEALKSPSENTKLPTKRRCIAKPIKKIGITPFFSKSFVKFSNNINVVVCDERTDFVIVRVFKEFGFRPKEIYLQKGQNLKWTWIGTDEAHNIINFTYQNSNDSQDKNSGKTYIHSGKPVINSSFVFPFDDPGDYLIISEGAPSHSCSVHVKDSIPRSSAPNISSQSELINDRVTVFLETINPNADIYYTTDGTLPALHLDGINHYKPDEGITMKKSGIVRAIALVKGEVQSYQVTSLPIWIETKEEDEEKDTEELEDAAIVEPQKQNVPSWWLCRPEIQGCFTGPGLFEVFWKLPELEEAKKLIKGYNIFLNDVCYCTMFPPSNNRVGLTGLAGGRTYQIYVVAYPKDPKNTEIKSKNLYAKCPILTEDKGPVISIVKTEKRDSIAIVWMSIDKSDCPIDGYLVFLNDTQCGPKLVPDANSNRCKVVIDGCDLDMDYKIHVQAVLKNFARTLISNTLYIRLPLNTADFVYPDIAERREDEDLYNEYIEVVEGSGYQTNIDNQASEVWETETDTTSGLGDNDLQKNDGENAFRAGDQDNINAVEPELDSDLTSLVNRKSCFKSYPTPASYNQEKQIPFNQRPLRFCIISQVVGRLCLIFKSVKFARSQKFSTNHVNHSQVRAPRHFHVPPTNGEGSGMKNFKTSYQTAQSSDRNMEILNGLLNHQDLESHRSKVRNRKKYFDETSSMGSFVDDDPSHLYIQEKHYFQAGGSDASGHSFDRGSSEYSQQTDVRRVRPRPPAYHASHGNQSQEMKQVRFAKAVEKPRKGTTVLIDSDSSFSYDDDSVEHIYQAAPLRPVNVHVAEMVEKPSHSQRRQKKYFEDFDSDHSNYDYSREESTETDTNTKRKFGRIVRNAHDDIGFQEEIIFYGDMLQTHGHLPQESSGMLARYLEHFGVEERQPEPEKEENYVPAKSEKTEQDPDVTVAPIVLPGSDDEDEKESVKHLNQIDDSTVFLDAASNKETVQTGVEREFIKLLGSEPGSKPGMGLAIIEVQKSLSLDKIGHQTSLTVPAADLKMTRVNEGELVPGDDNGLLPTPSIMARSIDRQTMEVGWRLTRQVEPPHELQLYVVNVMGTKFSSHINSDISYECNLVENGRQVRGVQHCWNIDKKNECIVQGLLTGNTYRTYVVCNFCMTSEGETCETQTSSPVLYYTIVGPPSPPTIQTTKVDTYQVCLEWAEQANEKGLQVRGFQIYVDEKPLGKGRSADVRKMTINNLVPGKTMSIYVTAFSEFGQDESDPSRTVHITCPPRPTAPVISQQPSYKRGSVLIGWTKPESQGLNSREEAISFYVIYLDGKWHGEVKSNQLYDKQGYRFYLTDLSPEQSYDVSVKAVAGERIIDQKAQHIYCLSESPMSNIIPVMAPAAPRSPKLRLEGLHPEGIDVTWQIPQQLGDAFISGYQMLKNGKLYGSIIPPDVNSLSIRDVILGEKIELQLIALTEHPVGKSEGSKDSGRGTSSQEEKTPDIFTGDHYAGCKPGPKLVVHYTGLVSPPSEVWCEKATGHSLLIVWTKNSDTKAHFVRPDSYQVTWWPGDRAKDEIQSDSTTDDHLLINGLRPSTSYTVVVEARKTEKYTDFDEAFEDDKSEGLNSFILSSKSEQLHIRTASPPDPPSNVGIVAMTCHSIKVGWDSPREHGSEIIGIRVECISQDPDNAQVVSADTLPDATSADLTGLSEKTDYLLKVITVTEEYFDQLPEKNRLKQMRNFPPNISSVQEESQWLPFTCILFKTSGTEPPCNVKVIKATMTALTLNWTPPLVYGTNKLTGQIVRWSAVRSAQQNKDNDLHIASHVKLLPTEDTLTIDDLLPGTQYNIVVEAVVSVKTSLEPEKWDGNNIEKNRRTAHVLSKPLLARTRAPIDPPQLMVTSYTQNSATLTWEKPKLVTVVGKDSDGNPKCLRRYLQGYKLEINGKLQTCIGPDSTSCTLTKCKPGRNYSVVLVAVSCTAEGRKARKQKYEHLNKESNSGNVDYMSLLQEDENLDEAPSDPLCLVLPRDQDGFLESLEAKFQPVSEKDTNIFGDIELSWKLQGNVKLVKQFSVVWYSMEDRVIQTKFVSPEQRRCTIPVSRIKTIYTMKVEPSYYSDVLSQQCQEIQLMVPGPPDAPQIFLRSLDLDEFSIEWGEPSLYGGVKVKGYQVLLNDIKAGSELTPRQTKATIPCKPKKTYRVNVIALSDNSLYGDSPKSNTLVINSSGQAGTSYEMTQSDDYGIPVKVVKVLENSIHLDWSNFVEKEELAYYTIQWSSVAQPDQREVKLSKHDTNCVINKCLPGTTHFMRVIALSTDGQILEKSKQMTIQTSAPPDVPKLSVRACNFHYIAIQWNKPTTYGDALITGYKVYVNGIVEAILNADQLSYTFTQGKWCNEYAFQVQALTAGETLNSKPSEPLIVTWPGSKPPELRRLPSVSSSTIRVAWSEPYLTDGIKVKHYKLCCVESGSDQIVQSVGPIHPDSKEGEIKNIKKGNYSVYLEIHLYGTDTVIKTEPFPMQPALSPDPPNISVALVGLEERRQIEKFTCDLVNKRDRLIREVGHKLKKIGALTFPMRAEKNEEVVMGAHSLTHIEELLESCFSSLDSYTGQLTAIVSWQCPQSNPDMQVSEYKLLVDGKQYGSSIPSGAKSIRIQLGLEQSSYKITMVACSDKPQGTSDESNAVEVLALTFKPFTYYCYHGIHIKDT